MLEITDEETINLIRGYLKSMFLLDTDYEEICKHLKAQKEAREKLGKPDLVDPNIKRFNQQKEKVIDKFQKLAQDCVNNNGEPSELVGRMIVNRNGGEGYEVRIIVEQVELPEEVKERFRFDSPKNDD